MSAKRADRLRKTLALVPMALLSAAWTASIAGVNVPSAVSGPTANPTLPDGTSVPTEAIEAPASVSDGSTGGLGTAGADSEQVVSTASTSEIPSAALSAYQRAETVINAADSSCHIPWELIAAIGRVESNHGRANANTLDDDGVAQPGIYGIALNGSNRTAEIVDTDAGQYDNDTSYDRAVGPMQFIPSTWSVVGVDADGDGVRNPQDIDDAALGTAVYLCSGSDDLGTDAGRQSAVYRYNHSQSYVDLVLAIMEAYMDGDFTTIPNGTVVAGSPITPQLPPVQVPGTPQQPQAQPSEQPTAGPQVTAPNTEPNTAPTQQPTQQPSQQPTQQPGNNNGNNNGNGNGNGNGGNGSNPGPASVPTSVPSPPTPSVPPVAAPVLTLAQATNQCIADGVSQLNVTQFQACLDDYMKP